MWSFWIVDTRTGRKLSQVEPVSGSFERKMNGVGTGTHTFVTSSLGDGNTVAERRASRLDLTRTWARTLVQSWDGQARYAGLIVGKSPADAGTVQVRTVEFRELLKYRTTFGVNGYNGAADGKLDLKNKTLDGIARFLLADIMLGPRENWNLPLLIPDLDVPGGNEDRTYHEWNLPIIETELADIQNADGGPDIDFEPGWTDDDTLHWNARVGDLSGNQLDWNLSVEQPALTDFGFVEDGNAQGNVFYAVGNGSERDLKIAWQFQSTGDPALERIVRYSQERSTAVLQGHANEDLRTFRNATRQYSLSMQADADPGLPNLRPGQTIRTYTQDHDWLPDGWLTHRLVGFSGGLSNTIKLQLQEQ